MNLEEDIRESTLANFFPELTKGKITKKTKKYGSRFQPKYIAFIILQNNIEDVVQRTTQMWKIIYGLETLKQGQEDPFKGIDKDEEETNKKLRRKYVATPKTDEEEEDTSQFRVVSHPPKFYIDKICDNIKEKEDMFELKNIEFGKLTKEEQNKVEESIYAMMEKFKTTPLELDSTMPKELYSLIENKWHYCLNVEKDIR